MRTSFENFLTSGIKLAEPETIRRVKVLNLFEFVFALATLCLSLFYFQVGASFLSYACIGASVLGTLNILLLRFTRKPALGGNLAVLFLWAILVLIRWNTGGLSGGDLAPLAWVWNAVLILLAIFMTGYQWGTIWACLVFVETGFAVFLYRTGQTPTLSLIPAQISAVYSLGAYLSGLLAVLLFAFLFEKGRHDALLRENEKAQILKGSRKFTEDILERSPIPTFVLDKDHRVVQWNRAAQKLSGVPPEKVLGKRVWEGFMLDEKGSLADKLLENPDSPAKEYEDSLVSTTESGSFAVRTTLPNLKGGLEAIVHTAPIVDQDGMIHGAIQTIQDINGPDHNGGRAGKPVSDIEARGNPTFRIDSKGKVSAWTKACEDQLGFSSSQILGHSPLSFVSKPHRSDFRETILRALKGESFARKEWKYYTKDGQGIHVLAEVYSVTSDSGQGKECVVINTDITDMKMRLLRLERMAAETKERYRELSKEYNLLKRNIATFIRKKEE